MTNEELTILKALHKLHLEAKLDGLAFQAIARNATPDSATAKEFEKMAKTAFNRAQIYYKIDLKSMGKKGDQYPEQDRRQRQERRKMKLPYSGIERREYKR